MSLAGIIGVGIVCLLGIAGIWAIATTNRFKTLDVECSQYESGVFVALEKRYDVLTKMLDVTRAYMDHESDLLKCVVNLREGMDVEDMKRADAQMNDFQRSIFARAESYPDLRSSEVFQKLQMSIDDAEGSLQAARRVYNNAVASYNKAIVVFPSSLLARNRAPKEFFELSDDKKAQDVAMDFSAGDAA